MHFLAGPQLSDAIHGILREDDLLLAIAFWGTGAAERLSGKRARVICNLAAGGTNPNALRALLEKGLLQDATLRQHSSLHAKVYIGRSRTIVASANLSTNGLGLDGVEQAFWEEAGVEISTSPDVVSWFEALWQRSAVVTEEDLSRVTPVYGFRQKVKPTVISFDKFDVGQTQLPYLRKTEQGSWKANDPALEAAFGTVNQVVRDRLDYGVELHNPADLNRLKHRWVLSWTFRGKSVSDLYWSELSDLVVPGAFFLEGADDPVDTVLGAEVVSPEPFDVEDDRFKAALTSTLSEPRFEVFRASIYVGGGAPSKSYYRNQEANLQSFWTAVQERYRANTRA